MNTRVTKFTAKHLDACAPQSTGQFQFIYADCIAYYINIWSFDPFLHRTQKWHQLEPKIQNATIPAKSLNGLALNWKRNTDMHPQA